MAAWEPESWFHIEAIYSEEIRIEVSLVSGIRYFNSSFSLPSGTWGTFFKDLWKINRQRIPPLPVPPDLKSSKYSHTRTMLPVSFLFIEDGCALCNNSVLNRTYHLAFMGYQFASCFGMILSCVFPICAYEYRSMKESVEKFSEIWLK